MDRKIYFKKLRSYQGVLVSATFENGQIDGVTLEAEKEVTLKLKNVFGKNTLAFSNGQEIVCEEGEIFELTFSGKINLI